ncbi:uncharacterized protein LOC135497072 [Lineus longissimus]|uniref:uncharacterized protein LOC135497072 n=1 Tax=Lineus longissimus TaxID=88925 RepID=UPI00315C97DB
MGEEPVAYRLHVHLFGGVWSPSAANFAVKQTALDHRDEFDDITIDSINNSLYVDDLCKSVVSTEIGTELADQLCKLLRLAGFHLTKWLSNDRDVIGSVPEEDRAPKIKDLDLYNSNIPTDRVLGVVWDPEADSLGVRAKVVDKPLTRRGVLSVVSSVYDPMGIESPFVLPAKVLIQELCRRGAGWDEPLSEYEIIEWERWKCDVRKLQIFSVNRCFHPCDFGEVASTELHHFSDASEKAYGSVCFVRQTSHNGKIHCTHVFAKSKLAPLNRLTVPRLELLAAVEAVKIDQMLRQELDIPITSSTFWTDSMLWNRLRRATAWMLRFKQLLLQRVRKTPDQMPGGSLTVEEIKQAEISIVRYVQKCESSSELRDLQNGKQSVKNSSPLYQLEPYFYSSGVMCVRGRIENAPVPVGQRHQMIVPTDSYLATLLVQHNHEVAGHAGREYVLSLLVQKFWLLKPRNMVQRVLSDCTHCRRKKTRLMKQRMANLPLDRVVPYEPPFKYRGIQWVFNPAAASHFGACWERLIRSIRSTLTSVMNVPAVKNQVLGDEELTTFMCEVESIDESTPMHLWPLARVVEVFPGKDNLVRSARVKTRTATLTRPIHKLSLLESSEEKQDLEDEA